MLFAAPKYAKGKLIDIGCGLKPYEEIFRPFVSSYFGVDYKPSAESHYAGQTTADLDADYTYTGLDGDSFDTLLSTQMMEHVNDTNRYVKECRRLLKQGGMAIFTIPMSWRSNAEPHDYHRFTRYSLEKVFTENGFAVVELREVEGAFATTIQHLVVFLSNRLGCKNIVLRVVRKILSVTLFSGLNYLALKFDKTFWDEKFCPTFLLVVQKQ